MIDISINCQSSIKFIGDKIIYFDPIKQEKVNDADYIFITHPHWDHFSKEDILKIKKDNTIIIGPKDIEEDCINLGFKNNDIIILKPNQKILLDNIKIETFRAYNLNKEFHPKENDWLGYLIEIEGNTYYIPGDTDLIDEINNIKVDTCFIPIGGVYTMTAKEAAEYINKIKPKKVIPIHYGMVVGGKEDLSVFKSNVSKDIDIVELIKL